MARLVALLTVAGFAVALSQEQEVAALLVGPCNGNTCTPNQYGPLANLSLYTPSTVVTTWIATVASNTTTANIGTIVTQLAVSFSICKHLQASWAGPGAFSLSPRNPTTGALVLPYCNTRYMNTTRAPNPNDYSRASSTPAYHMYGWVTTFYDPQNVSAQLFADKYAAILNNNRTNFLSYLTNQNVGGMSFALDVASVKTKLLQSLPNNNLQPPSNTPQFMASPKRTSSITKDVLMLVLTPVLALVGLVCVLAFWSPRRLTQPQRVASERREVYRM